MREAYGIAAALLILLLAFFGVRKRLYRVDLGPNKTWLQSHVYLGILAAVVALLHTGFRWHDRMALLALVLMVVVVVSGIVGAVLYKTVPPMLTRVETQSSSEEISKQLNQMARSMSRTASERSAPFRSVCEELLRETAPRPAAGWRLLISRPANGKSGVDWAALLARVPQSEQEALREMLIVSRQRRDLIAKLQARQRYVNLLQAWLYIHVPATVTLLVAMTAHVVTVLYFGGVR